MSSGRRRLALPSTCRLRVIAALALLTIVSMFSPPALLAQPADLPIPTASGEPLPSGIRIVKTPQGALYADRKERILYGMDMRTVLRSGPDPTQYCTGECAKEWQPLLAPAGTRPNIRYPSGRPKPRDDETSGKPAFYTQAAAPDWTVIAGPAGPQWVYKGWHMAFTRRGGDVRSTAFDGAENHTWNTLKFVPPVPELVAPGNVKPAFVDGRYVLVSEDGRALFTGQCKPACTDWQPLPAGMASAPLGQWAVATDGDSPRWTYRGKPVFVSQLEDPSQVPATGKVLVP